MPHIPVDPNREYKPMEIFQFGLILNTKGNPDYRYILRLITHGKIKAKNICQGTKGKMFKVMGQDIIDWKKSTNEGVQYVPDKTFYSPYTFKKRPFPQS